MGKDSEKVTDTNTESRRTRFPFTRGLVVGLVVGVAVGWWFRPPSSFRVDELRAATEAKFDGASDVAREELADFAENLAKRLRESPEFAEQTPVTE